MAQVVYDHVVKTFGEVTALHDLSLEISDREFVVLVGPSGSGKTTALRLLAGLETLTGGSIRIGERTVDRVAPRDRDIAMVFQDYALYPQKTVYQNLAFGLRMRKMPKHEIDVRVLRAAEMLDIGPLLQRRPGALSGGQRQRVALGRALVREPRVFLMDEPLSNLDAQLRVQTRSEIKHLQEQVGTTTVYVTHDQVEAMTMGDRVAVMSEGQLEQVGDPRTIYDEPANVFVAGFIGSPAMGFWTMRAERRPGALGLIADGTALEVATDSGVPDLPPEVVVGVRPEHAQIWRENAGLVGPVEGRVSYVEMLGRETFIGIETAGAAHITVRAEPDVAVRPGERVPFGFEPGRLHLFDPTTERAIARL
jgi:multiple sugar transport system ATP-binding protein